MHACICVCMHISVKYNIINGNTTINTQNKHGMTSNCRITNHNHTPWYFNPYKQVPWYDHVLRHDTIAVQ